MGIFDERINIKPFEYPAFVQFADAINHSYWLHTEFSFTSDIQDFNASVNDYERDVIKKAMLAIAQIEVNVKSFWANIYKKMPKPEVSIVGYTFAESEVRHLRAYSHLLELMGLNKEFERLEEIPAIIDRIKYLKKYQNLNHKLGNSNVALSILLFSLFIENVSLFSQFLIINSFSREKNIFKGISNVIDATAKEEDLHAKFGMFLVNTIKEEYPEWFNDDLIKSIHMACKKAYKAENRVLDWIFEGGELSFLERKTVDNFIKSRYNSSLIGVGIDPIFEIDEHELSKTEWFEIDIASGKHFDFFYKRPTNYTKFNKTIDAEELF
jgi:ribonucleoside-diphosphate reductase beta chain